MGAEGDKWYDSVLGFDGKVYGIPVKNDKVLIVDMDIALQNIEAAERIFADHSMSSIVASDASSLGRRAAKRPSVMGLIEASINDEYEKREIFQSSSRASTEVDFHDERVRAILEERSIVTKSELSLPGWFTSSIILLHHK